MSGSICIPPRQVWPIIRMKIQRDAIEPYRWVGHLYSAPLGVAYQ